MQQKALEKKIVLIAPAALHGVLHRALSRHGAQDALLLEDRFIEEEPGNLLSQEESAGVFFIGREEAETSGAAFSFYKVFSPPFRLGALMDAISGFRAGAGAPQKEIVLGPYLLNPSLCLMTDKAGKITRLTEKECAILVRLHDAHGQLVEKQRLLEDVWGYSMEIETHTLETHIYRLRRKIEQDPAAPLLLLTEEQGYRLL